MKTEVILAAGGQGTRLKASVPKSLVLLAGQPLLTFSLRIFESSPMVDGVVVVAPEPQLKDIEGIIQDLSFTKVRQVVPGGRRRRDSVARGLAVLEPETGLVAIHDAARPLISAELLDAAIKTAQKKAAVIVAVPVKPTIKQVNPQGMTVEGTLDRKLLWEVQTPQVFRKDIIIQAHQEFPHQDVTDDAALVEMTGQAVHVVLGDYRNLKITTPEDLITAEGLLASNKPGEMREGKG